MSMGFSSENPVSVEYVQLSRHGYVGAGKTKRRGLGDRDWKEKISGIARLGGGAGKGHMTAI